ncbi:MAG: ABC transporter permease [Xanthomonadales bacterium]|nr:ABC transporter permease [Xanthomonadales bacterium]ODU93400.1 MAG: peptide ABC transporter permease [Rhodanobacter sp. SCN 66-43]OJY83158.1 MAG: peptide ABC transporter permease [Xanthomonadales bacterium 66-474]
MTLHPILAALKKHKAGVTLITLQIALTLAIVCNAVFIIGQRVDRINRPSGIDENNLFLVTQSWVGAPTGDDEGSIDKLDSMQQADVATLRNLPDVESAIAVNTLPLVNSTWSTGISLKPDQQRSTAQAALYFGTEQMVPTLGLKLVAGRNFTSAEIGHMGFRGHNKPPVIIVTKALGDKLFPKGDALGKTVYIDRNPTTIVGIVERMQVPSVNSWANSWFWNSVLIPTRLDAGFSRYAVRAKPGRLDAAMREAPKALYASNPMRVIETGAKFEDKSVHSFAEIRRYAYRADRGMAVLMGVICLILLCVTGAGIVGLTSFWVGQRRKQIGIRRALGATQVDILRYFQTENLMIAGVGVVLGAILAVGLNLWLMKQFQMDRMSITYVLVGVVVLLVLGQGAVFAPARRASKVSPVEATRSV